MKLGHNTSKGHWYLQKHIVVAMEKENTWILHQEILAICKYEFEYEQGKSQKEKVKK